MSKTGRTSEEIAARVKALESMMIEQGLVTTEMIDHYAEVYENKVGPQLGAQVVARAWVDPDFKARLLQDASAACAELGIGGMQGEHMVVLEDTADVHHAVVCTLCSCYPWPVLGTPPNWYKDPQYRSRMIREPRTVLAEEFGYVVDDSTEIRVWDSSSEIRYWVLPRRPEGTEGWDEEQRVLARIGNLHQRVDDSTEIRVWDSSSEIRYWVLPRRPEGTEGWDEEQLAALVSRDAMIGVGAVGVAS